MTASRTIQIINGAAQIIRQEIEATVPLSQLMPLLASYRDNFLWGLPSGLSHVIIRGNDNQIDLVIQQPPKVRTITYGGRRREDTQQFALSMPWIYFIFTILTEHNRLAITEWKVFGSARQVRGPDDMLYPLPVHNVYHSGAICFGSASADPSLGMGSHIDQLVRNFWLSTFNDDVQPTFHPHSGYEGWQRATESDPTVALSWDTATHERPLRDLVMLSPDRTIPVVAPDAIPPLPIAPTFGRVAEWLSNLTDDQQNKIRAALP